MARTAWRLLEVDGLTVVRCDALAVRGIGHAFSTRRGPHTDDFDIGSYDATGSEFDARRRLLCAAAGLPGQRPAVLRQVHGAEVVDAEPTDAGPTMRVADGVIALRGQRVPASAVRTADCVPLLLAAVDGGAVAAVHAGWRGTAAGIAAHAVRRLSELGFSPSTLLAAIGPSIGPCCYDVGADVLESVAVATAVPVESLSPRPAALDLRAANRLQLERAGVPAHAIHVSPWCTACEAEWFYSYRRHRGPTGSSMACIGWSDGTPPAFSTP